MIAFHKAMIARLRVKERAMVKKHGKDIFAPPPINKRLHFRTHGVYEPRARA